MEPILWGVADSLLQHSKMVKLAQGRQGVLPNLISFAPPPWFYPGTVTAVLLCAREAAGRFEILVRECVTNAQGARLSSLGEVLEYQVSA
jgi:hypothetical protein